MKTSLKKLEWLVKGFLVYYVLGLILGKGKRVCTKMAEQLGISHDLIYRYLSINADLMAQFPDLMIKLALHFHAIKPGWLVIDDTAISKIYARYIEGVHWVYNSSLGHPEKGLCIVVIAWTNGDIIIPLGFSWWFSKKLYPEKHETKGKLAQKLIREFALKTGVRKVLADAAYISVDMIKFANELHVEFVTRIHSNRKVTDRNGHCEQLKRHPIFRLKRNQRSTIAKVAMQDLEINIVCFKRENKHSCEYEKVFLITNSSVQSSKEVIKMYNLRWEIEPMFRTMKQSLGLMECSSRSLEKQTRHVNAVFFGFSFIQQEKFKKNLSCSEDAIRSLQKLKISASINSFIRFCRDFYHVA